MKELFELEEICHWAKIQQIPSVSSACVIHEFDSFLNFKSLLLLTKVGTACLTFLYEVLDSY